METNDYPRVGGRTMRTTTAAAAAIGNSMYLVELVVYIKLSIYLDIYIYRYTQHNMLYNILKVGSNTSGNVS
jgi:hypothetical protein